MKKNFIANAFSISMFPHFPTTTIFEEIPASEVPKDCVSVIGHPDTAAVLTDILGFDIPNNRVNLTLEKGDVLYVAQLQGGRLPEGSKTLPEGYSFKFIRVKTLLKESLCIHNDGSVCDNITCCGPCNNCC